MYGILMAFYVVAIPMGYMFGFYFGMGLSGLWYGIMVGIVLLASYYFYMTMVYFDWEQISMEAKKRELIEKERCKLI